MQITAIKTKNQAKVNKFVRWNEAYNTIVDETDDGGSLRQERAYDKACTYWEELPKYEQKNISTKIDTVGY